jgi:threonine dehydrogenase-like Zn-dependent dehydrogenase
MPSFTVFKGAKDGVPRKATTQKPDRLVGDQVYVRVTASGVCGTGTLSILPFDSINTCD